MALSRAEFLVRGALAAGAAGLGAAGVANWTSSALAQSAVAGDVELLQFALSLEELEYGFYHHALDRPGLLDGDLRSLVQRLHDDEEEHVDALKQVVSRLKGAPLEVPRIDLDAALSSRASFLRVAADLEETGVGAYNATGPLVQEPELLVTAGAIVAVEAAHAALIKRAAGRAPAPVAFDEPLARSEVRAALDGLA